MGGASGSFNACPCASEEENLDSRKTFDINPSVGVDIEDKVDIGYS